MYRSVLFSQVLVTLVPEELSVDMISYYSFSKGTNMLHISEKLPMLLNNFVQLTLLTNEPGSDGGNTKDLV